MMKAQSTEASQNKIKQNTKQNTKVESLYKYSQKDHFGKDLLKR